LDFFALEGCPIWCFGGAGTAGDVDRRGVGLEALGDNFESVEVAREEEGEEGEEGDLGSVLSP
jgi:hypothetical protein